MKRNSETKTIGELMNSFAFGNKKDGSCDFNNFVKYSTIFSFWEDIVGKRFVKITRPKTIKFSKLYIDVKSPVVVQELLLLKSKLLEKINSYAMPLGIKIKDVAFDYKNFEKEENNEIVEDKPVWYQNDELQKIELDKDEEEKIIKNVEKLNFLDENQKKELISKMFVLKKYKSLDKNN